MAFHTFLPRDNIYTYAFISMIQPLFAHKENSKYEFKTAAVNAIIQLYSRNVWGKKMSVTPFPLIGVFQTPTVNKLLCPFYY